MARTLDNVMASLPTERRERIRARASELHAEIIDRQRALNDRQEPVSEPKSHDLFARSDAAFRDHQAAYPDDDWID